MYKIVHYTEKYSLCSVDCCCVFSDDRVFDLFFNERNQTFVSSLSAQFLIWSKLWTLKIHQNFVKTCPDAHQYKWHTKHNQTKEIFHIFHSVEFCFSFANKKRQINVIMNIKLLKMMFIFYFLMLYQITQFFILFLAKIPVCF
jgi:hypothetical protein